MTRSLLDALAITEQDEVVEFAPGLGLTAKMTLKRLPRSYTAIERDESAAECVRRMLTGPNRRCLVGRAEETGLPDACATVVYGEAMLSMQTPESKRRIIGEAARLLKPGGRYGIHEIALCPGDIDDETRGGLKAALSAAIHHRVDPLTAPQWRELFEAHGLSVCHEATAPMHLLEPRRLVQDEGLRRAMRFVWNVARDAEARQRVFAMRGVFRRYADHMRAIIMVGLKR